MDKELFDFVENCARIADSRNLANWNPVVLRVQKPTVAGEITVVCSIEEPSATYFADGTLWIPLDPTKDNFKKAWKLIDSASSPGYQHTWEDLYYYSDLNLITEVINFQGPPGSKGDKGDAGEKGDPGPIRGPVECSSTDNFDLENLVVSFDNVQVSTGQKFCLRHQINKIENGIYFKSVTGLAERDPSFDANSNNPLGLFVYVRKGDTYGREWFIFDSSELDPRVGIDNIDFVPFRPLNNETVITPESGVIDTSIAEVYLLDSDVSNVFVIPTASQTENEKFTMVWFAGIEPPKVVDTTTQTIYEFSNMDESINLVVAGNRFIFV